ncbi:MAG: helix-turn-helix transcriptional regulator [Symploca sp. SIO2G7]|nr:helix-turn-helix transcriptional regulator [Symploca sp. SIO2G7]
MSVSYVIMVEEYLKKNNPNAKMLKNLRARLGRTQADLAETMGVALRTWQQYEEGSRSVRFYPWQVKVFLKLLQEADISWESLPDRPPDNSSKK